MLDLSAREIAANDADEADRPVVLASGS